MPPPISPSLPPRGSGASVTPWQLRTFATVAVLGSVRRAAEHLSITESAVSATLGALQRSLGAVLYTRQGRGLRLTAAGHRYADDARRVLGLLDEAAAAAVAEADPRRGRLRLAAVTSAGEVLLPRLLASFRGLHPDVGLDLEVAPRARVWEMLHDHAVDLAVAGRPPLDACLSTLALCRNELVVVAAPGFLSEERGSAGCPGCCARPGPGRARPWRHCSRLSAATDPGSPWGPMGR